MGSYAGQKVDANGQLVRCFSCLPLCLSVFLFLSPISVFLSLSDTHTHRDFEIKLNLPMKNNESLLLIHSPQVSTLSLDMRPWCAMVGWRDRDLSLHSEAQVGKAPFSLWLWTSWGSEGFLLNHSLANPWSQPCQRSLLLPRGSCHLST